MAFPDRELKSGKAHDGNDYINIKNAHHGNCLEISGLLKVGDKERALRKSYQIPAELPDRQQIVRFNRQFVYLLLCACLGKNFNHYGILTGVRPVKLVHQFMDQGLSAEEVEDRLSNEYLLSLDKAQLLTAVALNNRPFLPRLNANCSKISIYIGIPYCPSRCYYCSFPGAILTNYEQEIIPYMDALKKEMQVIGDYIRDQRVSIETIYLGGGTPTVLRETELERIFDLLAAKYVSPVTLELTVEAGRPDTLSPSKIKLLQQAGVSRICINPQTMNNATLCKIGRKHDQKAVIEAFDWARQSGISHINMDLIVGLAGESACHYENTAREILKLQPDNITVHTLAVKRGSTMAELEGKCSDGEKERNVFQGVNFFSQVFTQHGYEPYYLYRQKYMRSSMENTGYSLPGNYCVYNIQMIEERQTIIGMGAGAASKFVNTGNWRLTSFHNPKNPAVYCQSIDTLISRKVDKLRALN
ncbi:MAG: coproporphyrinogen dehydrogenase HemZ [Syntrophomonadaceae bacterium]|jgi:oxygen-independent coproporphyrinogen-3 oxidase